MKDEASQKPKRTIFPSLIWEGGKRRYKFSIYFVLDCGYIVRERGRISGRHFSPSLPQSESNFLGVEKRRPEIRLGPRAIPHWARLFTVPYFSL